MPGYAWTVITYLIGSIPAALLAGRWLQGIDLRDHGSGNLGATNVYRTLGLEAAIVVFSFDLIKGALPVILFPKWTAGTWPYWGMVYGVAAIVGHVRPIYLRGKGGGKGVATASGVVGRLVMSGALKRLSTVRSSSSSTASKLRRFDVADCGRPRRDFCEREPIH